MEMHEQNMMMLMHMMSVLRERQSSWYLSEEEREKSKLGIRALEAAVDALKTQVYA